MILRPPRSTRTDTLFPDTTRFRSVQVEVEGSVGDVFELLRRERHVVLLRMKPMPRRSPSSSPRAMSLAAVATGSPPDRSRVGPLAASAGKPSSPSRLPPAPVWRERERHSAIAARPAGACPEVPPFPSPFRL